MDNLVDGVNEFSFKVFNKINHQSGVEQNVVFSSYSLVLALLMAMVGSKNETKIEIIRNLHIEKYFETDKDQNNEDFFQNLQENLIDYYNSKNDQNATNKMVIANKALVNNQNLLESYQNILEKRFHSKIDMIRDGSFKQIVKETNDFIAEITNDKIKNLLDESFETASLVLINVIYFNFEWLHKFDDSITESNQNFYLDSSRTKFSKVNMMNMHGKKLPYFYLDAINSHLIRLPYQNEKYFFNVIFPSEENDYLNQREESSIINKLDYTYLKTFLFSQNENQKLINLRMPKFVIQSEFEFSTLLKNLGIEKAFSRKDADFSGITGSNDLYIDKIIQNAFIEVNEKGTEAAAATAIKVVKRSIKVPLVINLDRPYIFLITDNSNGLILFSGVFKGTNSIKSQKDEL